MKGVLRWKLGDWKTNAFLNTIFLWLIEPSNTTRPPPVDSVVVRFRWVKSRPCFEREVYLISSLVSKEIQLIDRNYFCRRRGFLKHIVWILVLFYNTFVNLIWENIRKLNWRNWLCFRLFTFDNAFRWSRVAFVKARFYLKGYWKYCDSKSLPNERNWYLLVSICFSAAHNFSILCKLDHCGFSLCFNPPLQ